MFNSWKLWWLNDRKEKLEIEFANQIMDLRHKLESDWISEREKVSRQIDEERISLMEKQKKLELDEEKLIERRFEVQNLTRDYEEQIKVLEAKVNPSGVWEQAFSAGVEKAWDFMIPLMRDNIVKATQAIKNEAIEELIRGSYTKTNGT